MGGLSVLQALRSALPDESFVYLADHAYAPYGEKGEAFVCARSLEIARFLVRTQRIKALVVACNTATAAAVDTLRAALPRLIVIGVEPALKPAARHSRNHGVGVLATRGTLQSARFAQLRSAHAVQTRFVLQACDGLAAAIEQVAQADSAQQAAAEQHLQALCARYVQALGPLGRAEGAIDTLVLGCTHYVFVRDVLQKLAGPGVALIDTGAAVARHTRDVLQQAGLQAPPTVADDSVLLQTTGGVRGLQNIAQRWLGLPASVCQAVAQSLDT